MTLWLLSNFRKNRKYYLNVEAKYLGLECRLMKEWGQMWSLEYRIKKIYPNIFLLLLILISFLFTILCNSLLSINILGDRKGKLFGFIWLKILTTQKIFIFWYLSTNDIWILHFYKCLFLIKKKNFGNFPFFN